MATEEYLSPEAAEVSFYEALRNGNLATMESVWSHDHEIICIHPGWPELKGYEQVLASWRQIFANQGKMQINHQLVRFFQQEALCVRVGKEFFTAPSDPNGPPPAVVTNIIQLTDQGWKMILHHASPTPFIPMSPGLKTVGGTLH